ncbi:T9SS type A sorting domain-containing protein [Fibrella aquatica]|uniref:T9SS type A sorting domain-containing protein n=1 Tax=Fibrella aquatica TaxID=3242487 RepID=UPI0035226069
MRLLLLILCWLTSIQLATAQAGTPEQRITITAITPAENTGQNYQPWLSDNLSTLVQDAWSANQKWVQVSLTLQQKSIITRLSLYDYQGSFTDKPALLYALNGKQRILIGSFDGSTYKTWVNVTPFQPLVADAIMIYKYGNNIPQKIKVYGQPITSNTPLPQALDLLKLVAATDKPVTGQDYSAFLNNDMSALVPSYWQPGSQRWTDVTIKLEKKSLVTRLDLYDYEGTFEATPAEVYLLNGKEKTLIGQFTGNDYQAFKPYSPTEPLIADAILIHKFGNAIPVKIRAYGKALPHDPLDAILRAEERVKVISVTTDLPTPQQYSAYLNDDMNSLVADNYSGENERWIELTLKLEGRSDIHKLELFDGGNTWGHKPAEIYALNGTSRTLLGHFTGPEYMAWLPLTFQTLTADAIVIRKHGNALPLKIKVFGHPAEPAETTPESSTTVVVSLGNKIPLDASRWYQLNNTSGGLGGLFDGHTDTDIQTGWGKILPTYDAYYPLNAGESMAIKAIKFYDGNGSSPNHPLRLSIITSDWRRVEIAQFQGLEYNEWVGPYPTKQPDGDSKFLLDNVISDARYLVINTTDFWPREIELYGTHEAGTPSVSTAPRKSPTMKRLLGINAFEWDFYQSGVPGISAPKLKALQSFGVIRHYMDWEKLELTEGNYTFNPTHAGGWNYDLMYERSKAEGIEIMTCFKDISPYLKGTYPADQQGTDNVPVRFGSDYSKPQSYVEQARAAFQFAARYGKNTQVDPALMKVSTFSRWTNDPVNVVKIGLGLINYIECENERDKWWRGRTAYQTGREYAANMSAFYDGHKNTMGAAVGVKNADPSMTVVMGGLASISNGTDYIRGMIDWCKEFRGYKADGRVDLCWDVINYHLYPDNANSMQSGTSSRGSAPELSVAAQVARNVLKLAHEACYDMPVYISETGYDLHQGSPLKAIAIGNKSVSQTQADWNLRTALLYGREGIDRVDFYQTYDLNLDCATQFCSMGFINEDFSRKLTADYFYQTKKLMGEYAFKETISTNPNVDRYEHNGQSAYALWIPDETGRTGKYTLELNGKSAARVYSPQAGKDTMAVQLMPTTNGKLDLTLTETPIFVMGVTGSARMAANTELIEGLTTVRVYPNPASGELTIGWGSDYVGDVTISLVDANLGITHQSSTFQKKERNFSTTLNLSKLPYGLHLVDIRQGDEHIVRRILNVK